MIRLCFYIAVLSSRSRLTHNSSHVYSLSYVWLWHRPNGVELYTQLDKSCNYQVSKYYCYAEYISIICYTVLFFRDTRHFFVNTVGLLLIGPNVPGLCSLLESGDHCVADDNRAMMSTLCQEVGEDDIPENKKIIKKIIKINKCK